MLGHVSVWPSGSGGSLVVIRVCTSDIVVVRPTIKEGYCLALLQVVASVGGLHSVKNSS